MSVRRLNDGDTRLFSSHKPAIAFPTPAIAIVRQIRVGWYTHRDAGAIYYGVAAIASPLVAIRRKITVGRYFDGEAGLVPSSSSFLVILKVKVHL